MRKYGYATFKVKVGKRVKVKPDPVRYTSRPGTAQRQQNPSIKRSATASERTTVTPKPTKPITTRGPPPQPLRARDQPRPYVNMQYGTEHPIYEDESF